MFTTKYRSNLMLIDTMREREIHVGRLYPYQAQEMGECIMPSQQAAVMGVGVGDIIYAEMDMGKLINTLGYHYVPEGSMDPLEMVPVVDMNLTRIPCKISALNKESYGKFGTDAVDSTLIMEYRNFLPFLGKYLPSPMNRTDFAAYL